MYFMFLPIEALIPLIPALIFAMWAQGQVKSAYAKYSKVRSRSGITGAQAARRLLDSAGLQNIPVEQGQGHLTDHYDPKSGVIRLSPGVYQSSSLAALGIAAHETGHAMQHADGYVPLEFRNNIFPVANFGSRMALPLFFIGFIFSGGAQGGGLNWLMDVGILFFAFAFIFQLVTLPVEFNASSRAVELLEGGGFIGREEVGPTRKVLNAAALTYIAAAAVALAQLIRLLILRNSRD
ncbi:zinc metallopeptidase [Dethiobacter alkaliphilus]|uniref:Peptidase membrane zinc metallopeptidase putative n=1 Tax=Dethiobacter alkaliphilus AHT 1 TaxID=555088 RepID=C0GIQ3_DETAL|nr:zinc metallopeptidase [Dethiobacter alkaliphilus]EEG76717.1 peptidase membrane zinc metallopeptidase putative [Dethiobacter alkaliphilus AHT 1]